MTEHDLTPCQIPVWKGDLTMVVSVCTHQANVTSTQASLNNMPDNLPVAHIP